MKVEDFVKQMNGQHKEGIVEKHIRRQYVPFSEKIAVADNVIKASCYKDVTDAQGKIQKVFWTNSVTQRFLTIRAIISMYTDLEFSENPVADYDALAEKGYDKIILEAIPEDAQEFVNIVSAVYDDEYENVNSIQGRFKNMIMGFDNILQDAVTKLMAGQIDGGDNDAERIVDEKLDRAEA